MQSFLEIGRKGAVAQLVEQRTENPCVAGSIPAHTTITNNARSSNGRTSDFDSDCVGSNPARAT